MVGTTRATSGDELFKEAFESLWPALDFTYISSLATGKNSFFDHLHPKNLWIGGGSFLDQAIECIELMSCPLSFIGVGIGGHVDGVNAAAILRARILITRDKKATMYGGEQAPDLVFGIKEKYASSYKKGTVILLNDFLTPRPNSPAWQTTAWHWFVQEFAQVVAALPQPITFVPMCINRLADDRRAAAHVLGFCRNVKTEWEVEQPTSEDFCRTIAGAELVVTQRLHGAILALKYGTDVRVITHHDKLQSLCDDVGFGAIPYYGFSKAAFIAPSARCSDAARDVYLSWATQRWNELSHTVMEKSL